MAKVLQMNRSLIDFVEQNAESFFRDAAKDMKMEYGDAVTTTYILINFKNYLQDMLGRWLIESRGLPGTWSPGQAYDAWMPSAHKEMIGRATVRGFSKCATKLKKEMNNG